MSPRRAAFQESGDAVQSLVELPLPGPGLSAPTVPGNFPRNCERWDDGSQSVVGRVWLQGCVPMAETRARLDWKGSLRWKNLNPPVCQGWRPCGGTVQWGDRRWAVRLEQAHHPTGPHLLPPLGRKTTCPSQGWPVPALSSSTMTRSCLPADLGCHL